MYWTLILNSWNNIEESYSQTCKYLSYISINIFLLSLNILLKTFVEIISDIFITLIIIFV